MVLQPTGFSVAEVARELGISLQYAYSLVYSGKLPAQRLAGRWRISSKAVDERRKKLERRNAAR